MKILLLGEYSNVHATLAEGLKALGHQVLVVSNGDFWKDYPRDISLVRNSPSRIDGILYVAKLMYILPKFRGFDIVQLINPMFLEIKAEHVFTIYHCLRKHNKRVILCGYGMDWYWVNTCMTMKPLRYSDFNMGDQLRDTPDTRKEQKDWLHTPKECLNRFIARNCDAIITGLYEYYTCYHAFFPQKTVFIPFPIKPAEHTFTNMASPGIVIFFIGINKTRSTYKGTDIMLEALDELKKKYPDKCDIIKVESVPFNEYQQLMNSSDCILDQLYSYTPAMNSLLAMSKGIINVGGGEEENYLILNEKDLRPIINVQPNKYDVFVKLEQLILHQDRIHEMKKQSIEYVNKHHDYIKVAKQYLKIYKNALEKKI